MTLERHQRTHGHDEKRRKKGGEKTKGRSVSGRSAGHHPGARPHCPPQHVQAIFWAGLRAYAKDKTFNTIEGSSTRLPLRGQHRNDRGSADRISRFSSKKTILNHPERDGRSYEIPGGLVNPYFKSFPVDLKARLFPDKNIVCFGNSLMLHL